jgi:hypothetical protein
MENVDKIISQLTKRETTLEDAKQQLTNLFNVSEGSELEKDIMKANMIMLETIELLSRK